MRLRAVRLAIIVILSQLSWFACVLGAAPNRPWIGPAAGAGTLVFNMLVLRSTSRACRRNAPHFNGFGQLFRAVPNRQLTAALAHCFVGRFLDAAEYGSCSAAWSHSAASSTCLFWSTARLLVRRKARGYGICWAANSRSWRYRALMGHSLSHTHGRGKTNRQRPKSPNVRHHLRILKSSSIDLLKVKLPNSENARGLSTS